MVDPTYKNELQAQFSGSWLLLDSTDVPRPHGLLSTNMEYIPGAAKTRLGFSQAVNTNEAITSMFNWISSLGDLLVYYRSSDNAVRLLDIAAVTPTASTVIAGNLLGHAASYADAGARLYLSFFDSDGIGASGARVISYQSAAFVSDLCFQPPIIYDPGAPSEPTTGTITQGLHYLGYRIEYRSGFVTRPSPDSGIGTPSVSTFLPVPFTAAGGANAAWTLNTVWPVGAVRVHVIMTPVANQADWRFVPGAFTSVTGGVLQSVTITFDISDDLLFANGTDSTPSLFLLTNTVANAPQILPSIVCTHGDRMSYITTVSDNVGNQSGAVYMSNKNAYQEIAPDQSLIQLPGLKDIITAISLDAVYYIFGPQWTYRTSDNGADPITWAAPQLVDGRRGTLAPRGACVSPSGTYGWVASQDGLYYFPGVYQGLPISYYQQPDWDRINWDAQECVDIKDDPTVKKVYVIACLDGAESPSHLLTWDYTNGFDASQVQYSLDSIQGYSLGCMEVVKNALQGMPVGVPQKRELWLGPSDQAPILRRNSEEDNDPFLDDGFPIFSNYESGLFPREGVRGEVYQHHGADYRVKGQGTLRIIAYSLDHAQSYDCAILTLAERPGLIPHRSFDLISEGVSHLFTQGENLIPDGGFEG